MFEILLNKFITLFIFVIFFCVVSTCVIVTKHDTRALYRLVVCKFKPDNVFLLDPCWYLFLFIVILHLILDGKNISTQHYLFAHHFSPQC
jgi:hypothetical protein